MTSINVHQVRTTLSAILASVESEGESFVICRNGVPVADLIPHKKVDRTSPHPILSKIKIDYDPTEPLDQDEWPKSPSSPRTLDLHPTTSKSCRDVTFGLNQGKC